MLFLAIELFSWSHDALSRHEKHCERDEDRQDENEEHPVIRLGLWCAGGHKQTYYHSANRWPHEVACIEPKKGRIACGATGIVKENTGIPTIAKAG